MHVLSIVVSPFVFFLFAIVLSVLLRYTDSDYPFGIFTLSLHNAVDHMISGDQTTATAILGNQIKNMLEQNNVVYNKCPLPAQTLAINNYVLHLPKLPGSSTVVHILSYVL
jgi:hypothetical protein